MPSNIVIKELEPESIPGGYPTSSKSSVQSGKDTTPILEFQSPQGLPNANDLGSSATDISGNDSVSDESLPEKLGSDNGENNSVRSEVVKNEDSNNNISSASSLSKDSIPFDLNGDYNIHPSPSAENDSISGHATQHYVAPLKTSPENDSISGHATQHYAVPLKTSPENLTSRDENPHYNTPTDLTTNDPSSINHAKNVTNVLYSSRDVGPDGGSGDKCDDVDKQLDQNDRSPHKATKKDKVNAKIGTLKRKIGKLINL